VYSDAEDAFPGQRRFSGREVLYPLLRIFCVPSKGFYVFNKRMKKEGLSNEFS